MKVRRCSLPKTRSNLIIGQSGGATAVINASLVGAIEAALKDDDPERVIALLRKYDIHYLLYIGGNDSADTAHRLAQVALHSDYDFQTISIPKTIDNDLPFTDHSPGYGSAARFIALATMDSSLNTASIPWHYPVKVIETMGRNAGWLAAASALGKRDEDDAPHIILIPEKPFNADRFLKQVEEVYQHLGYVIVVASEAVRDEQGIPLGSAGQAGKDAFHHPLLSGAAQYLVELVKQQLKLR